MTTIPASKFVSVTPGVLAAGGSALDMIGLILTDSPRAPIGSVLAFPTDIAVGNYFGPSSQEVAGAEVYFQGFDNSNVKPGSILFAQYPKIAVSAYLRGGNLANLSLSQLQALNQQLSVAIDGITHSATISLAGATSFSNAAQIIANVLGIIGAPATSFTGSIAANVLTASALTGALGVGQVVAGAGVTVGTYITQQLTGPAGGAGTYQVSVSQTVASEAMTSTLPAVVFDSISGGFQFTSPTTGIASTIAFATGPLADSLFLTQVTGAVLSQGADAATPSAFMSALTQVTQDWAGFTTSFNPDNSGNANKLAFAAWNSTKNNRYLYVPWDTDVSPTVTVPATASLGQEIIDANYSGTSPVWEPSDQLLAFFVLGTMASIDFTQQNGRITFEFKSQTGLQAGVTSEVAADNLEANGYNYYAAVATANQGFVFYATGTVSGPFQWLDSYVNQIWLNNALQLALMLLLTTAKSIPYTAAGYALIETACQDPINAALNFGAIRPGVTLSSSQSAAVNAAAGLNITSILQTQGWYLLVRDASPSVRQVRGSPPITFFYTDGEAVQRIELASIDIL